VITDSIGVNSAMAAGLKLWFRSKNQIIK